MNTDILIIGGGLAGLALADRLQRQGHDDLLVEARPRLVLARPAPRRVLPGLRAAVR